MKIKLIFLTLSLLLLSFAAQAQTVQPTPKPEQAKQDVKTEQNYTAQDYENLLAKLKGGDTSIDFTALRMAFTKTKEYSYSGTTKAEKEKFLKPFNDKNYKDALKQAEKFMEKNYVDANAHFVAYNAAKELKDEKKAEFYKAVLLGLLASIKDGNDGLSAEKPFRVISIDEEYTLMRFLGYQFSSQSLQNADGHQFDVFAATNAKTKENVKLYFNIDIVWKAETDIFK
jgi:hypothetical protein